MLMIFKIALKVSDKFEIDFIEKYMSFPEFASHRLGKIPMRNKLMI